MKRFLLLALCSIATLVVLPQNFVQPIGTYSPAPENIAERNKFQDMKFGLFIHWGIYSVLGDGEWVMRIKNIPYENYKRLADFFNPQQFDAKEWVQLAKRAGMKYITIIARHHDGFSMFKTAASQYNIVDATPFARDPLMELAHECAREGIDLHFYYSLLDWGRKDYGFGNRIVNGMPANTDWNSYITFMKKQLTELITRYPNVTAIWFDGHWERPEVNWHYDELYALIHKLNPKVLVGNNHHLQPFSGEDFQMFEKDLPGENASGFSGHAQVSNLPLETCETMNNSWGFNINDNNFKSVKQIIHYLVNAAGRNANFLLNVGPMPNGKIQQEFSDTLTKVGMWMKNFGASIYGTRAGVVPPQQWGVVTSKNNIMYAHILKSPDRGFVFIPGVKQKVSKATLFATGKRLQIKQQPEGVFVYLSSTDIDEVDTIIQLQ